MPRPLKALIVGVLASAFQARAAGAMYESDHWDNVIHLNEQNLDDVVKENVDAGKTLFIRWVASEG